jgi:mycofactocin system glycosyltransferase
MALSNPTVRTNDQPLMYRLRSSARFHRLPGGKAVLVLQYPLRAAIIPDFWQPILACLRNDAWLPLERISAAVPRIPIERIELFLNSLIRKGYIDQEGYPLLAEDDYPMVSVIIPVRNRPDEIADGLLSLTSLDYPAEKLEIIVVDDASTDTTPEAIARFSDVRLIRMQQHRQASFCRNRAAEIARGDILAFIDSDCLADPTWLRELVPAFRDDTLGALGGRVDGAFEENGLDRYEKVKSALKMGSWFKRSKDAERFFYVPACNFLVRKDVFIKLSGFREKLHVGEDVDFCWRLQDAGYSLEFRPMGKVSHKHRNRLAAFCVRRFDYGTSEPVLQELHAGRVKTLFLPWTESLFWLTVILSMLLKIPLLLLAGAGLLLADGFQKYGTLKKRQIPVTRGQVFRSVIRSHLSFVYHCCSFISRYYLVVSPLVLLLSPLTAVMMMGMHLTAGIVDYTLKRPQLNPISYLFFFTLEQVSYQSGVWWECIRRINFKPVLPRIVHKRV